MMNKSKQKSRSWDVVQENPLKEDLAFLRSLSKAGKSTLVGRSDIITYLTERSVHHEA
jgi:hypothetical protein